MKRNDLFTTNQVAKICSVSRATVLRMETRGLVIPSYRESETMPRYYTITDIARLSQVLSLCSMGFSFEQIRQILDPGGFQEGIQALEANLYYLNRLLEELRGRFDSTHIGRIFEFHVPDTFCYCLSEKTLGGFNFSADLLHRAFLEAVEKGLSLGNNVPFFLQIDRDITAPYSPKRPVTYTACIPVLKNSKEVEGTRLIPGSMVLSVAWAGPSREIIKVVNALAKAVKARGYRVSGPLRICTRIDHYGESDITDETEVVRFHLPVERI